MDPRIREHARTVVDHCIDLRAGDTVVVAAPDTARDLVVALYEYIGDVGAYPVEARSPLEIRTSPQASRAYLRARAGNAGDDGTGGNPGEAGEAGEAAESVEAGAAETQASLETPAHHLALFEETDAFVIVRSYENVSEPVDVPSGVQTAVSKANRPILEERLSKPWCLTQYPAAGHAQLAGMATEAYENFVWDAVLKDWDAQREFQQQLVDILDPADEVRIVSGESTDVRMRLDGNHAINDYGERNLPGGEVFTAPRPDSVEGEVLFDKPLYHRGREVTDAFLRFEGGEVVEHAAAEHEAVLSEILETDEGASRLGELGIGMNRDIDRFTFNVLFDEKMGDTVHMALGNAYADTVGEDNDRNESAAHVDMIVDTSEDSFVEVDGDVVQRDGTFVFEDEFGEE